MSRRRQGEGLINIENDFENPLIERFVTRINLDG